MTTPSPKVSPSVTSGLKERRATHHLRRLSRFRSGRHMFTSGSCKHSTERRHRSCISCVARCWGPCGP
ncbi:hypothetical protein RHECNPAF_1700080 [Rhizobium etli CNPAF512]|nr:hypothetical protein RHECNPAF_1700080 [Rhizobium etli CNPAF512]